MSEENEFEGYENMSEEQKEAVRKLRTRIPAQDITVTAELDPKILAKNEWFNRQATRLAKELTETGHNTDSSEITPENFQEKVNELKGLEQLRKQASIEADPTRRHSSGTLTLEGNRQSGSEEDEWDSVQEMLDDIQRIKRTGSDLQRKKADKILKVMTFKTPKGMEEKASLEGRYVKSYEDKSEKPMIQGLNEEFRRRRKAKRDDEK